MLSGAFGQEIEQKKQYKNKLVTIMHIHHATIDTNAKPGERVHLYLHKNEMKILLCTLIEGACENVKLDLLLFPGEEISFTAEGSGSTSIHLVGVQEELKDDLENFEGDSEEDSQEN
ncbi:histone deacetylase hdt2 [Anaeramoeba flamelloides]|uniref:Histone deacetylase hdt2 n=1 Tax=Anaeramoeba flamelloides TaxID=1746091 RepID=A0AAV7ZFF8_9EUKA|nr:histone deacetylase hdt2 [Anaeramoeba flamelloides]KAJ6236222.1 histone deacetylase hdt2 [Anaeramoeba flamelloides]